ncbi:MAG: DUF4160 domain-containing protein [Chitinophagales bacterium]
MGIVIYMYYRDHSPPHFHAEYNQFVAQINIQSFEVIEGKLPPRILGLVAEWASIHQQELLENWQLRKEGKKLKSIAPLA